MTMFGKGYNILNKQFLLLCDETLKYTIVNREAFNKYTNEIFIYEGVRCDETLKQIDNKAVILIEINYETKYFDETWRNRSKQYIFTEGVLYKEDGSICNRTPKEVKSALNEFWERDVYKVELWINRELVEKYETINFEKAKSRFNTWFNDYDNNCNKGHTMFYSKGELMTIEWTYENLLDAS